MPDTNCRITKWHLAYNTHSLVTDWSQKHRVMLYSQQNCNSLQVKPHGPIPAHSDITLLTISLNGAHNIEAANVYNALAGCIRPGEGVQQLQKAINIAQPILVLGDFNLRHKHWNFSLWTPATHQAKQWQDWCNHQNLSLLNKPGTPTHQSGSTVDLVWTTAALSSLRQVTADVDHSLDTPSDHHTLWINMPSSNRPCYGTPGQFRIDILDNEQFGCTLSNLALCPAQNTNSSPSSHPQIPGATYAP